MDIFISLVPHIEYLVYIVLKKKNKVSYLKEMKLAGRWSVLLNLIDLQESIILNKIFSKKYNLKQIAK